MAVVFREDVEGLALGVVPATAQWDEVTGTPTVVNTQARSGTKSVEFNGNLGVQTLSQLFATSQTTRYLRRSFLVTGRPTTGNTLTLMRLRDAANASAAEVRLNATGNLVLRNGAAAVTGGTSTTVVPLNAWFGLTWGITGTTQSLRYYADPATDTATETLAPATSYSGTAFTRVVDGCGNAANNAYFIYTDEWLDDDTTWPTVQAAAPAPDTGLKILALRGGTYTALTDYRAVGGAWV
jgi:hypothetical protein